MLEGMDAHEPLGLQELQLKCLSPAGHLGGREKLRQGYWTKPAGHGWGHKAPNVISLIQLHGHTTSETRLISKSLCLARVPAFLSICLFDNWSTNRFFFPSINQCVKPCFQDLTRGTGSLLRQTNIQTLLHLLPPIKNTQEKVHEGLRKS